MNPRSISLWALLLTWLELPFHWLLVLLCRVGLHQYVPADPFRDYWLAWFGEHDRTPPVDITREVCTRCGHVRYPKVTQR